MWRFWLYVDSGGTLSYLVQCLTLTHGRGESDALPDRIPDSSLAAHLGQGPVLPAKPSRLQGKPELVLVKTPPAEP